MSLFKLIKEKGIINALKIKVVQFAKSPDTIIEKIVRGISIAGQLSVSALNWSSMLPAAIITLLTGVHTAADNADNFSGSAKWFRILSVAGQIVAFLISIPISMPATIITGLTALHTFIDNLRDFLDDGKMNKSVK